MQTIGRAFREEESVLLQCSCEGLVDKTCQNLILWHALLKDLEGLEAVIPDLDLHFWLLETLPSACMDALTKFRALIDPLEAQITQLHPMIFPGSEWKWGDKETRSKVVYHTYCLGI